MKAHAQLTALLKKDSAALQTAWSEEQLNAIGRKVAVPELRAQCQDFLRLFLEALESRELNTMESSAWAAVRKLLSEVSRARSQQGFTPSETATFIFSLKRPLFENLRREYGNDAGELADLVWLSTEVLDRLGLFTTEIYQKSREEIINRQQEEMLELSTPVVKLWDGVLALPMIGTLDSSRTQVVMESLLEKIMETGSEIAIIDITGVPTVDTLVAQHLIKTVTAARLMGAECIISGIRPQIAATIVHLGVELGDVVTKASLADAFVLALARLGRSIDRKTGALRREIRA